MKENYINYITHTRMYSEKTVKSYTFSLTKFDNWLGGIGKTIEKPEEIKLIDFYNFMESLSKDGLSARTCAWVID